VLQVQGEVNNIQEEIESAAGRVEFLSHQSSFSTINLTFFQPLAGYKPADDSPGFLTRLSNAFKTGSAWIADLFVGLISIWPLLLLIAGLYFGWKKIKSSRKPAINADTN
jgi:ABC-type amino acid transport system permease subunit